MDESVVVVGVVVVLSSSSDWKSMPKHSVCMCANTFSQQVLPDGIAMQVLKHAAL